MKTTFRLWVRSDQPAVYRQVLIRVGVNFMEKTISIRNTEITFSIWDLGGQREFVNMLPLVCNDAVAILFMFDLTRKSTLNSIKEWYRQGRGFNKTAIPFLIGTKYDHFVNFPREDQEEISTQVSGCPYDGDGLILIESGSTICTGDESQSHLQQYQPQHQRPKGNLVLSLTFTSDLTEFRSSRSFYPRLSISNAPSQRSKMLASHYYCTSRSYKPQRYCDGRRARLR
jgi:GTPase SAR1 family protein